MYMYVYVYIYMYVYIFLNTNAGYCDILVNLLVKNELTYADVC
jgi:hypothetical protein